VLDVGAGEGALTAHLLTAGARVLAVELHPGRAQRLRARFAGKDVRVLQVDAASLRLPHRPFRVVANPPFSVSSALLRTLLDRRSRLVAADIVLQRAVVRRHVDGRAPGARRVLSDFDLRLGMSLPRKAFRPPPHVDAAVLVIRRR
jgi:23S rRNA (adenine-N6)-dimethyltransferase